MAAATTMPQAIPKELNLRVFTEARPYTLEEKYSICEAVFTNMHEGNSLRQSCRMIGIAYQTVNLWWNRPAKDLDEEQEKFVSWARSRYHESRIAMLDRIAEDTIRLSDQSLEGTIVVEKLSDEGQLQVVERKTVDNVQRAKLMVDSRKWLLSKLDPGRYGEKVTLAGDPDNPVKHVTEIKRTIVKPSSAEKEQPKI